MDIKMKKIFENWRKHTKENSKVLNEAFPSSLDDIFPSIKGDDQERAIELARDADEKARDEEAEAAEQRASDAARAQELAQDTAIAQDRAKNPQDEFGNIPSAKPAPPKPSPKPKPKRKVDGKMRQKINQLWKSGKIDKDAWRKARRALYKGVDAAQAVLDAEMQTGPAVPGMAGATDGSLGGLGGKRVPESPRLEEVDLAKDLAKGGKRLGKALKRGATAAADALSKVVNPKSSEEEDKARASKEAAKAARAKSNERPKRTQRPKGSPGKKDKARASKEAEKAARKKDRGTSHGGATTAAAKAEKDARSADRKKRPQNRFGNVAKENFERVIKDLIYEVLEEEGLEERFDPLGLYPDDDQERAADAAQKAAKDIDATRYDTDKYGDMPKAHLGAKKGAIHSRPSGKHPNINPGAKKKPAPKPKRKIASGKMRQEINQMLKSGQIDKATWRQARRALYKSTDAAQAVLDGAKKKK